MFQQILQNTFLLVVGNQCGEEITPSFFFGIFMMILLSVLVLSSKEAKIFSMRRYVPANSSKYITPSSIRSNFVQSILISSCDKDVVAAAVFFIVDCNNCLNSFIVNELVSDKLKFERTSSSKVSLYSLI